MDVLLRAAVDREAVEAASTASSVAITPPRVCPDTLVSSRSMRFVEDVSVYDKVQIAPGQLFTKKWLVKNDGNCSWGVANMIISCNQDGAGDIVQPLPNVVAGAEVVLCATLCAPPQAGQHSWKVVLRDEGGLPFGSTLRCEITVGLPAPSAETVDLGSESVLGVKPGPFVQTCCVRNNGGDDWPLNSQLVLQGENTLAGPTSSLVPRLAPGEETQIKFSLIAPEAASRYTTRWQLQDAEGNPFANDHTLTVSIDVVRPRAKFVEDLTLPQGSVVLPGQNITKTWVVQNCGDAPWPNGSSLVYQSGSTKAPKLLPNVPAGAIVNISLDVTTPASPGPFRLEWHLQDEDGRPFLGDWHLFLDVDVQEPPPSPTPGASSSPPPSPVVSVKLRDPTKGTMRRFSLTSASFSELVEKVHATLGEDSIIKELSFVDGDGDECAVSCDLELAEAVRLAQDGILRLGCSVE
mmetsp:Transcript_19355/g.45293  ORF Transcript_19355/g.45293 Transcript_19355/m.45293 type:complete len:464 (+) Transcript_19355:2-1393(+)